MSELYDCMMLDDDVCCCCWWVLYCCWWNDCKVFVVVVDDDCVCVVVVCDDYYELLEWCMCCIGEIMCLSGLCISMDGDVWLSLMLNDWCLCWIVG